MTGLKHISDKHSESKKANAAENFIYKDHKYNGELYIELEKENEQNQRKLFLYYAKQKVRLRWRNFISSSYIIPTMLFTSILGAVTSLNHTWCFESLIKDTKLPCDETLSWNEILKT